MESEDLRRQLHEVRRGETAGWTRRRAAPRWIAVAFGVVAASWVLATAFTAGLLQVGLYTAHLLALFAIWHLHWRSRGTATRTRAPQVIMSALAWMLVAFGVTGVLAWQTALHLSPWAGAVVAGVGAAGSLVGFEQAHLRASRRLDTEGAAA